MPKRGKIDLIGMIHRCEMDFLGKMSEFLKTILLIMRFLNRSIQLEVSHNGSDTERIPFGQTRGAKDTQKYSGACGFLQTRIHLPQLGQRIASEAFICPLPIDLLRKRIGKYDFWRKPIQDRVERLKAPKEYIQREFRPRIGAKSLKNLNAALLE